VDLMANGAVWRLTSAATKGPWGGGSHQGHGVADELCLPAHGSLALWVGSRYAFRPSNIAKSFLLLRRLEKA